VDTVRVDISYRPLRIGWAIRAGDMDAFRAAARISFALWGGRFNPIIIVDQQDQAENLIDVFRVDMILPLGDSEEVKSFPKRFPHLINPFFRDNVFVGDGEDGARSHVLDIHNALWYLQDKPAWKAVKDKGLRIYTWAPDDPLANIFLVHFGEYPSPDEIHIDYRALLKNGGEAKEAAIDPASKLEADIFEHPSISFVSRYGIERHYGVRAGWDTPGFYSGNASNFDDLVCCWNLRAADIPMLFVDVKHLDRYGDTVAAWGKLMRDLVSHRRLEFERRIAVWMREEGLDAQDRAKTMAEAVKPFGEGVSTISPVGDGTWNGLNVRPPTMSLGKASTLGVIGKESGRTKISFSLDDKPFTDDVFFHTQSLVASLSFIGGLWRRTSHACPSLHSRT
jgi:hypothetical protein